MGGINTHLIPSVDQMVAENFAICIINVRDEMKCKDVQVDLGLRCLYRHKTCFYYHVAHFIEQAAPN